VLQKGDSQKVKDIKDIKLLLGDRLLIRPLSGPEKRGTLIVPINTAKEKLNQTDVWWGEVESLGRDAMTPDAYDIKVGDVVAVHSIGRQCETIKTDDGEEHCWVADEFIVALSKGRFEAFKENEKWIKEDIGIVPIGSYILVVPEDEEENKGGIHIPMSSRQQQKVGKCVAVSPGEIRNGELVPLHVENGSRVLFGRYSGSWARLDKDFLLMKQEDIVGIMEYAKELAHA
jgi:co-chaperonin GroES (HSP10)